MENNNIPEIPTEGEGYKPADVIAAADGEQTVAVEPAEAPAPETSSEVDGYRDFNGFTAVDGEQAASAAAAPQQPVQQLPHNYYTAPQPQQEKSSPVFGILSIVLGLLGCCCYSLPSIAGLVLGIIGVKKNGGRVASIIGIIISACVIAYWVYSIAFIIKNPEMFYEFMDQFEEALESAGGTSGLTETFRIFF